LSKQDIDLDVIFMATNELGRHYFLEKGKWTFQYRFLRGIHPYWKRIAFHFNPGIVNHLIRTRPNWTIIGGGWHVPTSIIANLTSRALGIPSLFWTEGSLGFTDISRSGATKVIRELTLSTYNGFVIPGKSSMDYINDLFPTKQKKIIHLPNFVYIEDYSKKVQQNKLQRGNFRRKYNLGTNERIFLIPARLSPEKGLLEFLKIVRNVIPGHFKILLVGDGFLRNEIESYLNVNNLDTYVRLLGHRNLDELLELYAITDLVILPSLRETYSFASVEALWAGLPLMISKFVGALPEVMEDGLNGWEFDPNNAGQVESVLRQALGATSSDLERMGQASIMIAQQRFEPKNSCNLFINSLLQIFPN
jgi:glycosyltransferase involved in cell wall biosynthesis